MMTIPKILHIGGIDYKIEFPYEFKERTDLLGQHIAAQTVIRLTDRDGGGRKTSIGSLRDTFFHETIHAILWQYYGEKEIDEQLVCALSHGLIQVLKDNDLTTVFEGEEKDYETNS